MSLPSKVDVLSFDYSVDGGPQINVAAKPGITMGGLDYSADCAPFYGAHALVPIAKNPLPIFLPGVS